jgi:hypothetical protein
MNHTRNNIIALFAIVLITVGTLLVYNQANISMTGLSVYDPDAPICHQNLESCIDLNGDGSVNATDEKIFACLLNPSGTGCPPNTDTGWISAFGNTSDHFKKLADFDNDNTITQLTDFQRCYVPMRDKARDEGIDTNITCNLPSEEIFETDCTFGCPDLNGDGYVDEFDLAILTNNSVWQNSTFNSSYPMADMNHDGEVDWLDRNCMSLYSNEYVLCNMPTYFLQKQGCADLANVTTDLDNDGFVKQNDKDLFEAYFAQGNTIVDFDGDNATSWIDKWIFDQYANYESKVGGNSQIPKVLDCNLFHAAWHTGGLDQNISTGTWPTTNFTVFNSPSQFINISAEYGWLTKIRLYMSCSSGCTNTINVTLKNNAETETIAKTIIPAFNGTRWVTAYFSQPPRLTNGTPYKIILSSSGTYSFAGGYNFETYMTTAYADLNGDGIVDQKDNETILQFPDNLAWNGTALWNPLYDLNNDSKINDSDIAIFLANASQYTTGIVAESPGDYFQIGTAPGNALRNGNLLENYNPIYFREISLGQWPTAWYPHNVSNLPSYNSTSNIITITDPGQGIEQNQIIVKPHTTYNASVSISGGSCTNLVLRFNGDHEKVGDEYFVKEGDVWFYNYSGSNVIIKTNDNTILNNFGWRCLDVTPNIYLTNMKLEELPTGFEWFGGSTKLLQKFVVNQTAKPIKKVTLYLATDVGNNKPIIVKILDEDKSPLEVGDVEVKAEIPALENTTPQLVDANLTIPAYVEKYKTYYIEVSSVTAPERGYKWFAKYD